jgi:hypothetical protein
VMKGEIDSIEKVQRRFTKRLPGMYKLSYNERLNRLNLVTLELRWLHNDLIYCYKILFGLTSLNCNDFFVRTTNITRGHQYKLFKERSNGVRYNFFSHRIVNVWNFLPSDVVDFSSVSTFSHTVKSIDFSKFLKHSYD